MRPGSLVVLAILLAGCATTADPQAPTPTPDSPIAESVTFEGCREIFLNLPIPADAAVAAVPSPFVVLGASQGRATLMVGVAPCDVVRFDDDEGGPATVSDVGVAIEAPDGSSGLHTYQLWQSTDSARGAARMRALGIPVTLTTNFTFDQGAVTPGSQASAHAEHNGSAYELAGQAIAPSAPLDFAITWWHADAEGTTRISYAFSGESGLIQGVSSAPEGSELAALQGGPRVEGAGFLPRFGGTGTITRE